MTAPLIAVAPIDGYALDLLRRHDPVAAAQVRMIDTTAPAPSERAARDAGHPKLA